MDLLKVLGEREAGVSELMEGVGLTDRKYFREAYLGPATAAGLVAPLYPDRPTHPGQKYLLTELGREVLRRKLERCRK